MLQCTANASSQGNIITHDWTVALGCDQNIIRHGFSCYICIIVIVLIFTQKMGDILQEQQEFVVATKLLSVFWGMGTTVILER